MGSTKPVKILRFFPVGFNQNASTTNVMRVPLHQDHVDSFGVDEAHEPKHPLLLRRNPHISNTAILANM